MFPTGCSVLVDNYDNEVLIHYGTLSEEQPFLTYPQKVTTMNAAENDFVFMNLTSTCNIDLMIVGGGTHLLDGTSLVHTPLSGKKVVFMHELVIGTDQRVGFAGSSQAYGKVNVCPQPNLLDSAHSGANCMQYDIPVLSSYVYIQADSTSTSFESQFLYYTIMSNETDNTTYIYVMEQDVVQL